VTALLCRALLLVALFGAIPSAAASEVTEAPATEAPAGEIQAEEIQAGDKIVVHLRQGGSLSGHALSWYGKDIRIRTDREDATIDRALVLRFELVEQIGNKPMPQLDEIPDDETPEGRRLRRLNRARAHGMGVLSFFIPGAGQFAAGQPALGSTYLIGTLVVDTTLVLSIVVNQDPVLAAVLGALELAARITSAGLAAGSVRKMSVWVAPVSTPHRESTGVMAGIQLALW